MNNIEKNYRLTIGMEVHAELKTRTKMFCACVNGPDAREPNTQVCPVCMGHPGTLPMPNREAIKAVIKAGLALGCDIAERSSFDRKNYFYPDLPKGYQITQFFEPLCRNGLLAISTVDSQRSTVNIRIREIHIEEDAGKLVHPAGADYSLVDFNRAGVPLLELVTEPDIRAAADAKKFCEELQMILRYLGVSDADMEKGQMRCEANVSIAPTSNFSPPTSSVLGTKVEVKNLNSFRAVERAIAYEYKRQTEVLSRGEKVAAETRGWDDAKNETFPQRSKEGTVDYRYFPEPDIPPLRPLHGKKLDPAEAAVVFSVENIRAELPELPRKRRNRFAREYGLAPEQIEIFTIDRALGDYFEQTASELISAHDRGEYGALESAGAAPEEQQHRTEMLRLAANYLINDLPRALTETDGMAFGDLKVTPENFAEFVLRIEKGVLSSAGARTVLAEMVRTGDDPDNIIKEKNLAQVSDFTKLESVVKNVIAQHENVAQDFKGGKEQALQFLVGQVMKETKGRANPKIAQELLRRELQR